MTISIFFSAILYQTSVHELDRGLRRPTTVINLPGGVGLPEDFRERLNSEREDRYDQATEHIISQLILINFFILIGGGALCYYLALRTLKPIEEAHEAQSRFTADASHELRTPITAIRTENEVALLDPKLTLKQAKQQLSSNVEELEKLTELSEGLLRLAQIDNNHMQKTAISAKHIAELAIERILPHAEKRSILITPRINTSASVVADEVSATEALVTLLDNAVKYSEDKSEVILDVSQDQKHISFTVIDTGPGIAPTELPHIFDRFYRADSSRTKQHVDGYGLGLAIARSIAESHDGKVTATSKLNEGSAFTLSLPIATN